MILLQEITAIAKELQLQPTTIERKRLRTKLGFVWNIKKPKVITMVVQRGYLFKKMLF
jgi:hypothetical protein